jgi:hypothetical protein
MSAALPTRHLSTTALILAAALLGTTSCATIFKHGHHYTDLTQVEGKPVRRVAVNISDATRDLQVFEGDQELQVVFVEDHIVSNAISNSLRQSGAEHAARPGEVYSWEYTTSYGPGLFLDPMKPHTLRFIQGGKEATVTMKSHIRPAWIWADAFTGPLYPLAWYIDGKTRMWRSFDRIHLNKLLH